MHSIINYKFKSCKNYSTVTFEGASLTLWELKYEIVSQRRMNAKDFDLIFHDGDTEEKIEDEYAKIPKNTNIIVTRVPSWITNNSIKLNKNLQNKHREPPESYTCFRCGQKGHFIQHCPTNDDKNFDVVRYKAPSGIPKEYLEKIEMPVESENPNLRPTGKSVLYDGEFLQARPQLQEWKKKANISKQPIDIPEYYKCSECLGLLTVPMKASCKHYYCEGCAYVGERCVKCRKVISFLDFDKGLENEMLEKYK